MALQKSKKNRKYSAKAFSSSDKGVNNLKAQEYLKQYKKQQSIIANCLAEVERWKDIALCITGNTEGERVQSSGSKQRMADAIDEYTDIKAEIKKEIADAEEIQREIKKTIKELKEAEYDVLHKVYIQGMEYKEIAAAKGKSVSWATSMHGNALSSLQLILDEREKVKKIV